MLQAVGGGLAGGAGSNAVLRNKGTDLMIAGIVWQVATLIAFAGLVLDYVTRTRNHWDQVNEDAKSLSRQKRFKGFIFAVTVAFLAVFLRCIYRIAEMVGGWANPIMRDEVGFMVMEAL
jgi:preprotein translocase subunit SecG